MTIRWANPLHGKATETKMNLSKVFDKLQKRLKRQMTQLGYHEYAFILGKETVEQSDIHLTNVLLKCGYPLDHPNS